MQHTEKKITEITKKVLKDIKFIYHEDKDFRIKYTESKGILGYNSKINHGILVCIDWYDSEYLGGNEVTAFLKIDDDTGEPEELSVRSGGGGHWVIDKDKNGNYSVKSNY